MDILTAEQAKAHVTSTAMSNCKLQRFDFGNRAYPKSLPEATVAHQTETHSLDAGPVLHQPPLRYSDII